jgi:hypothetical protein
MEFQNLVAAIPDLRPVTVAHETNARATLVAVREDGNVTIRACDYGSFVTLDVWFGQTRNDGSRSRNTFGEFGKVQMHGYMQNGAMRWRGSGLTAKSMQVAPEFNNLEFTGACPLDFMLAAREFLKPEGGFGSAWWPGMQPGL